jgi:hypothetical protein
VSEYEATNRSEEAFRLQSRREIDCGDCPFECAPDEPICGSRDAAAFAPLLTADQIDALKDALTDTERIAALERENATLKAENRALFRLAAFADHCRPTCASRQAWLVDEHHNGLISTGPAPCDCGYVVAEIRARAAVAKAEGRLSNV